MKIIVIMLHCDKNMNIKYQFGGNKKLQIDNPDSLYINIIYQLQKHYDYCKIDTIQNIRNKEKANI